MEKIVVLNRREFLRIPAGCGAVSASIAGSSAILMAASLPAFARGKKLKRPSLKERWMEAARRDRRVIESPLYLGRFAEPVYFLLAPIAWRPNPGQENSFPRVEAPQGFVSDLASIPSIFWTILRPDGRYAYAAIIHDHLYWQQPGSREQADQILKLAMEDLKVPAGKVWAIYNAVRGPSGQEAWDANAQLKAQGEKRVLVKYPPTAAMTWEEWKQRPDVFAR